MFIPKGAYLFRGTLRAVFFSIGHVSFARGFHKTWKLFRAIWITPLFFMAYLTSSIVTLSFWFGFVRMIYAQKHLRQNWAVTLNCYADPSVVLATYADILEDIIVFHSLFVLVLLQKSTRILSVWVMYSPMVRWRTVVVQIFVQYTRAWYLLYGVLEDDIFSKFLLALRFSSAWANTFYFMPRGPVF